MSAVLSFDGFYSKIQNKPQYRAALEKHALQEHSAFKTFMHINGLSIKIYTLTVYAQHDRFNSTSAAFLNSDALKFLSSSIVTD